MLNYDWLCQRCLRDHTGKPAGSFRDHVDKCKLPYSTPLLRTKGFQVYCVGPDAPTHERQFASKSVALTMHVSHEIGADEIGWYSKYTAGEKKKLQPHAFMPTVKGNVAGIVVLMLAPATLVTFPKAGKPKMDKEISERWCINRIWIAAGSRRQGVTTRTIQAIARHLDIAVTDLAWVRPNENGYALMRSICGDAVYFAAA